MNDGKCALFIRTSVSGGIVSMSQMSRNLSPPRAEPVKRGLPTFSSLLSTVIWVKNCRSKKGLKQCLGGLKCSQNTKKNKKTLKIATVSTVLCADSSGRKDPYVLVYSNIVAGLELRPLVTRVSPENLRSLLHYTTLSIGTEQQPN